MSVIAKMILKYIQKDETKEMDDQIRGRQIYENKTEATQRGALNSNVVETVTAKKVDLQFHRLYSLYSSLHILHCKYP